MRDAVVLEQVPAGGIIGAHAPIAGQGPGTLKVGRALHPAFIVKVVVTDHVERRAELQQPRFLKGRVQRTIRPTRAKRGILEGFSPGT